MGRISRLALGLVVTLALLPAQADEPTDGARTVEFFQARTDGDIEVKIVPKNATRATVVVTNKTERPLRIELPAAFAGVPVLAQGGFGGGFQGGGGGGFQQGGFGGGGGGGQSIGGGFGGGGGGLGGGGFGGGGQGGGGGGFFNLPPEAVKKVRLATVCLEHGKRDPNPRLPYDIVPIDEYTDNPQIAALCSMLGRGEIDQVSAQAAAWHLTDGLNWHELASKVKVRHVDGSVEMFFTPQHVQRAVLIVQETMRRVQLQIPPSSATNYGDYSYEH